MGMIIDKTEFAGIVVRSCHVPIDIVCRATDFVFPPGCPISVGTIVSFEVLVDSMVRKPFDPSNDSLSRLS